MKRNDFYLGSWLYVHWGIALCRHPLVLGIALERHDRWLLRIMLPYADVCLRRPYNS